MNESLPSNERLQEAEALIAMLSNDMDQHDFTRAYLPHWRPRLRAFLEGKPATYDPKDAPPRAVETKTESCVYVPPDHTNMWLTGCGHEHHKDADLDLYDFCPYCGRPVEEASPEKTGDQDGR